MDGKAMASALWTSLGALVAVLPPPQVVPALQRALRDLLAAEPGPARASGTKKNRPRWRGDIAAWAPLRERILATLDTRGMTRRELAVELGIVYVTLKPSLLPTGHAPSRANLARLQGWLEAMDGDGSNSTVATDASARRAYKLSTAERERLAGWRELEETRALSTEVGLTAEVIDQAVAGKAMAPPIIGRLVGFLEQQQPADSHSTMTP